VESMGIEPIPPTVQGSVPPQRAPREITSAVEPCVCTHGTEHSGTPFGCRRSLCRGSSHQSYGTTPRLWSICWSSRTA